MGCREMDSTADKAAEIQAETLCQLFQDAAFCMYSLMAEPKWKNGVLPALIVHIRLEAVDEETLLVEYLNEILFKAEELALFPYMIAVTEIASVGIPGESDVFVTADIVFADSMEPYGSQIKAATFHDLEITHWKYDDLYDRYEATVTFDV